MKETRRMSTWNQLDLQTLGSQPIMPKGLPDHCCTTLRTLEQWSGRTGSWLQMNRLSLRNNRLKFKTAGKLPIILENFIKHTPHSWRKTGGCEHVNRLDLQTLGSQPMRMPKNLPDHGTALRCRDRPPSVGLFINIQPPRVPVASGGGRPGHMHLGLHNNSTFY